MKRFLITACVLATLCGADLLAQTSLASHTASGLDIWGTGVDAAGNSIVTSKMYGAVNTDIDVQATTYGVTGDNAMLVAKYDSARNLLWSHVFTSQDAGYPGSPNFPQIGSEGCTFDGAGNIYVVGYFRGRVDFDPSSGVQERTALDTQGQPCANTAYLLKLSPTGSFLWVRVWRGGLGTSGGTIGLGVACHGSRVFVNGIFGPELYLDPENNTDLATSYSIATFVCVLTDAGSYVWGTGYASYLSLATNLTPDTTGGVMFALAYIVDIQIGHLPGSPSMVPTGNADTLAFRYDSLGNLMWMREFSGLGANIVGTSSARDSAGNFYVSGQWRGTGDFDPGPAAAFESGTGNSLDGFVVQLSANGDLKWFRKFAGPSDVNTKRIIVEGPNVLACGTFAGDVEFDSGPGTAVLNSGLGTGFLTRLDTQGNHVWTAQFASAPNALGAKGNLALVGGGTDYRWFDTRAALRIYTPQVAAAQQGTAVSAQITAVAGSDTGYSWSLVSGALPPGITGLPATSTPSLTLSGTPTMVGTFNFRVRVQDSLGASDERDFAWTITAGPPLVLAAASIPASAAGTAASQSFSASGGSNSGYYWTLVSGILPPGIGGIPGSGTPSITALGTPTAAGSYVFRLRVTDSYNNSDEADFTWTITAAPPINIAAAMIPATMVGNPASHTFNASGGSGAGYTWSVVSGNLPPAMSGVPGTGTPSIVISGTPAGAGTFHFRLRVVDSVGTTGEQDFTWTISALPQLVISTPAVIPVLIVGQNANVAFTASGGTNANYTWSIVSGALPPGLSGLPGSGTPSISVTGSSNAIGVYLFRVRVTDGANNSAEKDFTWAVEPTTIGNSSAGGGGGGGCAAGSSGPLALLALIALPLLLGLRRHKASGRQ